MERCRLQRSEMFSQVFEMVDLVSVSDDTQKFDNASKDTTATSAREF